MVCIAANVGMHIFRADMQNKSIQYMDTHGLFQASKEGYRMLSLAVDEDTGMWYELQ